MQYILGGEASEILASIPKPQRHNSIVLVDCHQTDAEYRKEEFPYYVALSHEVSWSSTIQVYVKILGSGMDLSPHMARTLLEATRLEAEPSLMPYMSEIDRLAIARLGSIAGFASTYEYLIGVMIHETEAEELFYRDYR